MFLPASGEGELLRFLVFGEKISYRKVPQACENPRAARYLLESLSADELTSSEFTA